MGKIVIYEIGEKGVWIKTTKDAFDTSEEAKKYLRFNGEEGKTYQIVQIGPRVKCEKVLKMKVIETEEE